MSAMLIVVADTLDLTSERLLHRLVAQGGARVIDCPEELEWWPGEPSRAGREAELAGREAELSRVMRAVLAGDLDAAQEGASGGPLAMVLRLRGRIAEARRVAGVQARDGLSGAEYAHAAALAGEVAAAEEALAVLEEEGLPALLARVWALAGAGRVADAADAARRLSGRADEPLWELFALHDVVRLGGARRVAVRLAELAASTGAPLARVFARHAAARTAAELAEVATEFDRFGMVLYAAEALAQAAEAHRATGRVHSANAAASRSRMLARGCQGASTPALVRLATPELTCRQREIAHLAAAGLTNREIAARLVVSIRTVTNHLCAIYDRVGVNDRAELAPLLRAGV